MAANKATGSRDKRRVPRRPAVPAGTLPGGGNFCQPAKTSARQTFFADGQPFLGNRGASPYYTPAPYLAPGPRGVIGTGEGHCFFFSWLPPDMVILAFRTADLAISAPGRAAGTDNVVRAVNVVRRGNVGRHVNVVRDVNVGRHVNVVRHVNGGSCRGRAAAGKTCCFRRAHGRFWAFLASRRAQVPVARPASVRVPWHVRQGEHGVFGVRTALFGRFWGPSAGRSGSGGTGRFDRDAAAAGRTGCFAIIGSADGRFWLPRRHVVRHVNVSRPNRFRTFRPFPRASARYSTLTAATVSPTLVGVLFPRVGGCGGLARPYLRLGHVQRTRVLTSLARGRLPFLSM